MLPDDAEPLTPHPSFCDPLAPSGNWPALSGCVLALAARMVHILKSLTLMLFQVSVIFAGYK